MIYNPLFKLVLFVILAAPAWLIFRAGIRGSSFSRRQSGVLLVIMLTLTFAVRVLYLRDFEVDVDTSTWLSSAITFNYYTDQWWTLLTYSDSRPLTVLPLILAGSLGAPLHYATTEIVGLLLWLGSAATLYYICSLLSGRANALLITASLCLFLGTLSPLLAAYNSEHISVFLLTVCTGAFIAYVYGRWNNPIIAALTGLVLGCLVYAKFQNAPMGILTGIFLLIAFVRKKAWLQAGLLLLGAILPTLIINLYYLSLGKVSEFWNAYFWNYYYYSYTTQFSSMTMDRRFGPARVVRFLVFSPDSGIFLGTAGVLLVTWITLHFRRIAVLNSRHQSILTYCMLLCIATLYAVLQSGNNFEHYKLYLLIPLLLLLAVVFELDFTWGKTMRIALLAGMSIQAAVNLYLLEKPVERARFTRIDNQLMESISHYSAPGKPLVVWGWRDQLHIKAQRPQGFRNAHPFHFSLNSPLVPFWTSVFLEDMETNKPPVFIEALLPRYSEHAEIFLPFEKIPGVNSYIHKHYDLVREIDSVRIFVRRAEIGRRED